MTDKEKHILRKSLASLEKTKLIDLILHQAERLDKLGELEKEVSRLRSELTTALRANKRQAAPFGKKKEKKSLNVLAVKKGIRGTIANLAIKRMKHTRLLWTTVLIVVAGWKRFAP